MGCNASQLQLRISRFGCVSGIAAQSTSNPDNPTKARLRAAPLTPKRATEIPVRKVLNEAPMEMATPESQIEATSFTGQVGSDHGHRHTEYRGAERIQQIA